MTMSKITGGGGGATSNVSTDRRSKEDSSCDGLVSAAESGFRALLIEGNKEEEVSRARSIVFSSRLSKEESGYGGALITNIDNELPAGVWVLIVANDPLLLNNLEQKLQASLCKVTSCSCPFDASSMLLEEEEYKFDFVVSALSFDMRNKDAYDHMLEQLSIKAGVPPITMSSDDSGSVVMKGVTRGEGGYLIKPIGMQAIQNICQHVAQKWRNELKHSGSIDGREQHLKSSKIWSYQINCQFNAALLQLGFNGCRSGLELGGVMDGVLIVNY
ncbi:Signal transduction response regulator [Macleaya cordata]|uniref:Signal transduction response regulator n=1 Tax=Macleaya cordata TaxID=56857 RepID=A0A200PW05_MACCD|nr:Signal transduction response regulator [Macleaya cordata]